MSNSFENVAGYIIWEKKGFSPGLQVEELRQLNAEFYFLICSVGFIFHVEKLVFTR